MEPKKRFRSEADKPSKKSRRISKPEDEWEGALPAPASMPPHRLGALALKVKAVHRSDTRKAALALTREFIGEELERQLINDLKDAPFWLRRRTFGRAVPRLQAFFALDPTKAKPYRFGGNTYNALPLSKAPASLQEVTRVYRDKTGLAADYLVLNCYQDEYGSILPHFDTDSLVNPIGCLSLGAPRTFCLHDATGSKKTLATTLPPRSLAMMFSDGVATPRHSVPKHTGTKGMRISITWRVW